MFRDPEIRKQIVIGLISSIVAALLIQPLLEWIWRTANNWTSSFAVSYTNSIYASAALGLRELHSFLIMLFMFVTIIGLSVGVLIAPLMLRNVKKRLRGERPPTREEIDAIFKPLWRGSWVVGAISTLLLVLSSLSILLRNYADLQLNATFNQRIAALSPALTDLETKQFKSRWALMASRRDYESIQHDLEEIARARNSKLPTNLWD
jgi:hypothetical protein